MTSSSNTTQSPLTNSRPRTGVWMVVALVVLGGIGMLFVFNPSDHAFYPRCLLYSVTGLQCPGCGGLRAMHQLLHGQFAAAWSLNPIAVLLLPALVWLGVDLGLTWLRGRGLPRPRMKLAALWIVILLLVSFTVLRNLPSH